MNKAMFAIVIGPLLLAACGSEPPGDPVPPHGIPPTPMTKVMYGCAMGETVELRFFPQQGVKVLIRQGRNFELHPQPVASGFHYTNGPYGVRGQGSELQLEVANMPPITCRILP